VHVIAAAASTESYGAWAYLAVFALMVLSFAGVPAVGAAVVGWGAILASQGKLNIFWVLIVAGRAMLAVRYYRRRRAHRLPGGVSSPEVSGESR
jgi:membrane protein DedA with SNARE-associated domain